MGTSSKNGIIDTCTSKYVSSLDRVSPAFIVLISRACLKSSEGLLSTSLYFSNLGSPLTLD